MKKIFAVLMILLMLFLTSCDLFDFTEKATETEETTVYPDTTNGTYYTKKPVIYLYPTKETEVSVLLNYKGELTCTYPKYNDGWEVTAMPDGTLIDADGNEYYCLYWEGIADAEMNFDKGFCIKGSDTAEFLRDTLKEIGLSDREANEFIIYWLPIMQNNEYNIISFQTDAYTDLAELRITPNPDSLLRVFMAYYPCDEYIDIEEQTFPIFERNGFVAVEWGGGQCQR